MRRIRVATNFRRLREACADVLPVLQFDLDAARSWSDLRRLLAGSERADVIIVNIDGRALFRLCLLKWLLPFRTAPVVSVDVIFSRPTGLVQRLQAFIKRLLLRKVDLFILYFRDLAGYERFYGIGPARTVYVPFKSNSWEILTPEDVASSDGDYVLAAGRTKRDIATYLEAMRIAGLPAVLLHQSRELLAEHGTTFAVPDPPANLRLIEHDGGRRSWVDFLKRARIIVVPILGSTISSSGIGTYIDAMAMRKAVVITDGPATRQLITDQAVVVPIADAQAMAAAVSALWNDSGRREAMAGRARRYAAELQGEDRLLRDVVTTCMSRGLAR